MKNQIKQSNDLTIIFKESLFTKDIELATFTYKNGEYSIINTRRGKKVKVPLKKADKGRWSPLLTKLVDATFTFNYIYFPAKNIKYVKKGSEVITL